MCLPTKVMILQSESGRNILQVTSEHMEDTVSGLEKEGNATTLLIMIFTYFCAHIKLIPPTPPPHYQNTIITPQSVKEQMQ
jgi:hypothetical protein